jgi:hypothetical protein
VIRRAGPPSVHALGLAGAAGALLAAAAVLPLDAPPLSLFLCPFRAATGLPCPSCGCTHAFHFAVRGQIADAFLSSPLGALLALACAVHVVWTILRLCGFSWAPRLEPTRALRLSAGLALLANWAFIALRTAS